MYNNECNTQTNLSTVKGIPYFPPPHNPWFEMQGILGMPCRHVCFSGPWLSTPHLHNPSLSLFL